MKRVVSMLVAVTVLLGLMATPASARVGTVRGCLESQSYFPATSNGLAWSDSDGYAFHTPMRRAGACDHVYLVSLGVYNAPPCLYARVRTYNEDRSIRITGPWYRFEGVGRLGDLRGGDGIDNMRLYVVYAYGCDGFRDERFAPGFRVYTHG